MMKNKGDQSMLPLHELSLINHVSLLRKIARYLEEGALGAGEASGIALIIQSTARELETLSEEDFNEETE